MTKPITSGDHVNKGVIAQGKRKLIEVALPLGAINRESSREKSIRRGHPSTIHLWWARRPLAASRALIFSQLVDDPSSRPEQFPNEAAQHRERTRLFSILEKLVTWEGSNDEHVLEEARQCILDSCDGHVPVVIDPFCGGGSIPIEAQRLGLPVLASDLNPVAVLITKALVEIPLRFGGRPPVNPELSLSKTEIPHKKAVGLAHDIRYYGGRLREKARLEIGSHYPDILLPGSKGSATVIAWLWARTVQCPNPACGGIIPLVRSFDLSKKKGRATFIKPIVDFEHKTIEFTICSEEGQAGGGTKVAKGARFRCLFCQTITEDSYVKQQGIANKIGLQLIAIVAEGKKGRHYAPPSVEQVLGADVGEPHLEPKEELPRNARWFSPPLFGLTSYADLFSPRQLLALHTFSRLIKEIHSEVEADAIAASFVADQKSLADGGDGARAYADALATYLALAVDKIADYGSSICSWHSGRDTIRNTFARQAIPMTWDFAETNPFSDSTGSFRNAFAWVADVVGQLPLGPPAAVTQADATEGSARKAHAIVITDPPYYDNIGYADLSDFFYVWLRRSLQTIFPDLFSTVLVPKAGELVATPYRFDGDSDRAKAFFEDGFRNAFAKIRALQDSEYPMSLFYAFKQAESEAGLQEGEEASVDRFSTGWETMLNGLVGSGFAVTATWPVRSEMSNRPVASGTNALASSIMLVCRPRLESAAVISRREFTTELRKELPAALRALQHGNISPVDLAQAAIGPGMSVYSKHARVMEADGSTMDVRTALSLINLTLDELLVEQDAEYDPATRWALSWFEQYGMGEGPFGDAETLSKAKNTGVNALQQARVVGTRAGKVRLVNRHEHTTDIELSGGKHHLSAWEAMQALITAHESLGAVGAAEVLKRLGERGFAARDLAYRTYQICDKKHMTQEALAYNALVAEWPEITRLAAEQGDYAQVSMDLGT